MKGPPKIIHIEVFSAAFFFLRRASLKRALLNRQADLWGVGWGVTEPDIKQKLGQVRGARRGRQERACGIEPCVGTNLTCRPPSPPPAPPLPPPSPVLSAHPRTLLHPHSPSLLSSIFSPLYSSPSAHTANSMRRQRISTLLVCFAKKWHVRMHCGAPFHAEDNLKWSVLL